MDRALSTHLQNRKGGLAAALSNLVLLRLDGCPAGAAKRQAEGDQRRRGECDDPEWEPGEGKHSRTD
jgi:hypothetical protein